MVAHERLAEADVVDELADAGRPVREAPDDPEPVDVGEGPVEGPDLAEVVGLVDDRRDRGAEPGGRRAQGGLRSTSGARRATERPLRAG